MRCACLRLRMLLQIDRLAGHQMLAAFQLGQLAAAEIFIDLPKTSIEFRPLLFLHGDFLHPKFDTGLQSVSAGD